MKNADCHGSRLTKVVLLMLLIGLAQNSVVGARGRILAR